MRSFHRRSAFLIAAVLATPACAETVYNLNQNQTGFNLPGVTLPQGQDEVRAADGTTCRAAVSGAGAYLDLGVVQGTGRSSSDLATYGRVVIPIGRTPTRLDCAQLYKLEVERLQMELKLLKMGVAGGTAGAAVDLASTASVNAEPSPRPKKTAAASGWDVTGWTIRGN